MDGRWGAGQEGMGCREMGPWLCGWSPGWGVLRGRWGGGPQQDKWKLWGVVVTALAAT